MKDKNSKAQFLRYDCSFKKQIKMSYVKAPFCKERFPTSQKYLRLRLQSYGPFCDVHKSGDLDLDLHPI